MQRKILAGILLSLFLTGCATTKGSQNIQVQQLQNQVTYLEAELQRKDNEIKCLENESQMKEDRYFSPDRQGASDDRGTVTLKMPIKDVQRALKNAGFYKGPIDGKMGPKTKQALKAFQKASGLKADMVVGGKTSKKLSEYLKNQLKGS